MKHKDQPVNTSAVRPPVVAVLGHVDHGKTTLLDYIRKTNVTAREHGGITQHIGAYQTIVKSEKSKGKSEERAITFIDTPGHEAFEKMRSRGATVADLAVLVVAADDSVKPQTTQSIRLITEARIPMIVALNKTDLQSANPEKVKKDLAKAGVQVEGYGGDVPVVAVSAKTGEGVTQLLEMILLVYDIKSSPSDTKDEFGGVVVETRLDKGKGMVATLIVKKGTLERGMQLYAYQKAVAKVRAMFDENGLVVPKAPAGKPVEVLGFIQMPLIGSTLTAIPTQEVQTLKKEPTTAGLKDSIPDFLKPIDPQAHERVSILLKADTAGSLEAVTVSLHPKVIVVASGIGDITEADILQAKSSKAIVIGFNVNSTSSVAKLAETEKVVFRTYRIIYELLDELTEVIEGLKVVVAPERDLGGGTVVAEFPYENTRIAGTKVTSGRFVRGDLVKITRGDAEIGRGKIKSIRRGKEDAGKVAAGNECGVLFDRTLDFKVGDGIIAYTTG